MANLFFLIAGEAAQGKSTSLRTLKNPEGVFYLGTEANKPLPFKSKFKSLAQGFTSPKSIFQILDKVEELPDIHTIVIDSLNVLMDMYESIEVLPAKDTRSAWGDYGQYFLKLLQQYVAKSNKTWIFIAHNYAELKQDGTYRYYVPIKGALAKKGVEAFFSIIVYARRVTIHELERLDYDPELLHITERDRAVGYKHVFQVDVNREMADSRIRSPIGCFNEKQIFMDNDCQLLIDHLNKYYEQ